MSRKVQSRPLTHRFAFHGDGASFFGIHLVTMFLSALTLGIYSFWGRVKIRRFLYSQTEFAGERFAYHGTGMELLKGWARASFLLGAVLGLNSLLFFLWDDPASAWITQLIPLALVVMLAPLAIVGTLRYRFSRTSWQGIRFSFRGRVLDFAKVFVPAAVLNVVTLGLYFPFFLARILPYIAENTAYGNERFAFAGKGRDLFSQTLLAAILTPLTLGLYGFWYQAHVERFVWDHMAVAGARFRSTVSGGGLCALGLTNGLLMIVTLGLAYPWVKVREARYKLAHLTLVGSVDWSQVRQEAQQAGTFGEGMADILDLELGV